MFGNQAFHTWAVILVGATLFAALFMVLSMMTELLFEGSFRMTRAGMGFGITAFIGYVGTAFLLRRGNTSRRE